MSEQLQSVFLAYSKGVPELDGKAFCKIFKDLNLFDKKFTATDADLIFAKIKPKGERKIKFGDFERGLEAVAEKKGVPVEQLMTRVASSGGPVLTGTKAEDVRFHDDKTTYTGVHKMGGPTTVDTGRVQVGDLSELCDRSKPNVRGGLQRISNAKTGDSK